MSGPIVPADVAFASSGAKKVPLLQNITQLLGSTANALQSIATAQLSVPYTIALNIPGPMSLWTARAGTDATDAPNGIVQAGDFLQTGIIWYASTP